MIRYPITLTQLEQRVDALTKKKWRPKAAKRLAKFKLAKSYNEKSGIWSEIKRVYMDLQFNKCAYCEKLLEGGDYGTIEHDVEHFRPKSSVAAWPDGERATKLGYTFSTGKAAPNGYYLLSYHLLNYCTSCKSCNSPLKSNNFPIAGKRGKPDADDPTLLTDENCYLIYPIGDIDDDPEELIAFDGLLAVPKFKTGAKHRRARVTIDFFDLNGNRSLDRFRAFQIMVVAGQLRIVESPKSAAAKKKAEEVVQLMKMPSIPHASCVRSFIRLWDDDRPRAEDIEAACVQLLAPDAIQPQG